jgi:tetratricopeptide (TPR) repeat protein
MTSDENPEITELPDDALEADSEPGPAVIDTAVATARSDDPATLIALYLKELEGDEDKGRQALLQHEIAEVQETRQRDEGEALKTYARALQVDPTLRVNVWAIRRIFWQRALWPNLLKLLDVEIRFTEDPHEKAELCVEKGQVLEDKQADVGGAREAYRKALEHEPDHLGALMSLERLCAREGDLAALADEIYPALARATPEPARKVAILLDLARKREAGEAGVETVLAVLEDAYAIGVERERVLREFERVAQAAGKRDEVLRVWERRRELLEAAPTTDPAQRALEIVAIRRRQAHLASEAGDGEAAWRYLMLALEACPDEPLLLREAGDLAARLGRHADVARLLDQQLARLGATDPRRLGLMFHRALALKAAGLADEAEAVLHGLDAEEPAYFPLLDLRQRNAAAAGDDALLAELLGREAEALRTRAAGFPPLPGAGDPAWLAAVEVARGEILERLKRDDDAVQAYRAALAQEPGYRPAIDALEVLFTRAGRLRDLAELLAGELADATGERLEYLLETLTRLHADRLGEPARALDYLRRLAEAHPGDFRALRRLQQGLMACQQWREVAELDVRLAAESGDPAVAAALRLDSAHIYDEELGEPGRAVELLGRVLEAVPGHPLAGAMLENILRRDRRYEDLIEGLKREVEASLSPERLTTLLFKIGLLYERELGKPDEAARVYRDIIDRTPGYAPAVRALAQAYRTAGDAERLAQALEAEVELLAGPAAQAHALVRLGEMYEERLEKDDLAEDAFSRALFRVGDSIPAALGLLRVYARRRDFGRFAGVCEQVAGMVGDDAARATFLEEAAQMASRPDGDPELAAELWARVRGLQPVRLGPLLALARAAAQQSQPAELADAYAGLARASGAGVLGAVLATRAATLAEVAAPGDVGGLTARYLDAVTLAPGLADPLVPLADVIRSDAPEAAEILARRMTLAEGDCRLQLMLERAEVLEGHGLLKEAAIELSGVLAANPEHVEAVEAVRRIAARGGDLANVAQASARLAVLLRDPARKATLFREAARILDGGLGRPNDAAPYWRQVLEHVPEDDEAYGRLHRILLDARDDGGRHELLSHRIRNVLDGDGRIPYLVERAELRLTRLGDRPGAARDLKLVLDINPDHQASLRQLGHLLAEEGAHREALELLERFLARTDDPTQMVPVLLEIAQIHDVGLNDPGEAINALERAADLAPTEPFAFERMASLHTRRGAHAKAVEALEQLAKTRSDPAFRARIEIRMAGIYRDGLNDLDEAGRALLRARQLDPLSLDAVSGLLQVFGKQRNASARKLLVDQALAEVREVLAQTPLKVGLYGHLARLFEWAGDLDGRAFAAQTQAFFNSASEEDLTFLLNQGSRPFAPVRDLPQESWRNRLMHPRARGLPIEVWAVIANAVRELHPQAIGAFNVGKSERVNLKLQASEWPTLDRIARTFGATGFELYASRDPQQVAVVAADPPALVVGAAASGTPGAAMRFRLGRALALLRDRTMLVLSVTPEELAVLFAAAARAGGSDVAYQVPAPLVEERAKLMGKLMSRAERKGLAVLAGRIGRELEVPREFRTGVEISAARAGLLVAGDLQVALTEITPGLEPPAARRSRTTDELVARFGDAPERLDLLAFATSADHLALRGELGLKVG